MSDALELSMSGALVRRVLAPETDRACYALELGLAEQAGDRVWLCAAPVWRIGAFEAVRFVALTSADRLRLAHLLGQLKPNLAHERNARSSN